MFKPRLVVAAAAALFATPVLADSVMLDPVQVTANRQAESSFEVPQPVTVLTAADIAERTPQVMAELLRGQPGVFFQQTGAGQGMAIVRGLKGSEVLHLVDGFRLNNAFFRTAPSQYIALVDPYNISQLEVLRGPYATYYGSDAMGGVVQITTPEVRFTGDEPDWRFNAMAHYASADLARVGRISHAIGNKTLSVAGGFTTASYGNRDVGGKAQFADGNGNIDFDSKRAGPAEYKARSYDLKAIWAISAADELTLSYQRYGIPEGLPRYNEVVPGSKPIVASSNPARFESDYFNDRDFYHLRYRHTAPVAFVDSLEVHLGRQIIEDDRFDRWMPNATTLRRQFEYNRSTLDGFTAAFTTVLGAQHTLRYGVELYRDKVDSSILRSNNTDPFAPSSPTSLSFKSRFPNGAETDNYGVYLSDAFKVGERLLIDVGVRGNRTDTSLTAAPESDRTVAYDVDSTDYSGQIGLRYALTPQLAYVANAGRGYRAPNILDLAAVGSRSSDRYVISNPALKPETINSIDMGFKWQGAVLSGEAIGFYSHYDDRIDLITGVVPQGQGECPAGEANPCSQNQNIQSAEYYGFEGALRYRVLPGVVTYGTLNYTRAEKKVNGVTGPGNRIPPLNGVLGAEWQVLPTLVIEPSVWMNGSQHRLDSVDMADNRIAVGGTAGFAVVNLRAGWKPNNTYSIQLFGENLLDKSYREHGSGIDGRGRGVGVTLDARF